MSKVRTRCEEYPNISFVIDLHSGRRHPASKQRQREAQGHQRPVAHDKTSGPQPMCSQEAHAQAKDAHESCRGNLVDAISSEEEGHKPLVSKMGGSCRRVDWAYADRLIHGFGWRYVACVVCEYGLNQGMGFRLVRVARDYWLLDGLGLSSSLRGRVIGFSNIPWQLKSLFGLLSDIVPLGGCHRSSYLLLGAALGVSANALMAALPPAAIGAHLASALLLCAALNVALADVMVDATVAVKCRERSDLASDLQSLCWGSLGTCQLPALIASGYALSAFGPRILFAAAAVLSSSLLLPGWHRWLGDSRISDENGIAATVHGAKGRWAALVAHPSKRRVAGAAGLVGAYSLSLGFAQLFLAGASPHASAAFTIGGNFVLCACLWRVLSKVDPVLGRAVVYPFLSGALCPSSSIIFEWAHAPASADDPRCLDAHACSLLLAQLHNYSNPFSNTASSTPAHAPPGAEISAAVHTGHDLLPCGWAAVRGLPCISPVVFSWVGVAGALSLVVGTTLYNTVFQQWRFRSIIAFAQVFLVCANFVDLAWVMRLNRHFGIPDEVMAFGDEVFTDVISQLSTMPFMIMAARLCPPAVEGSMFALFMGLSNFGYDAGQYLGAEMLEIFGGVHAPDFENLELYVLIRTLMRLLPLALIPFLVPPGSPNSSATELGLAASISADVDGSSVGDCAEEMMPAPSTRGVVEAPMPRGDSAAKATDCEMAQGNREKDT